MKNAAHQDATADRFCFLDSKKILLGLKEERERRVRHFLRKLPSILCFGFCLRLQYVVPATKCLPSPTVCFVYFAHLCTLSALKLSDAKVQRQQKRKLWIIGQFSTSDPQN